MKSQAEVLYGSGIIPDDEAGIKFTEKEEYWLETNVDAIPWDEWVRICEPLGLVATTDYVPENFEQRLRVVGRWTLAEPKQQDFVR